MFLASELLLPIKSVHLTKRCTNAFMLISTYKDCDTFVYQYRYVVMKEKKASLTPAHPAMCI